MKTPLWLAFTVVAASLWTPVGSAQDFFDPLGLGGEEHLHLAEAKVEPAEVTPGSEVMLVLDLWLDEHWHVYGALEETGEPPTIAIGDDGPATAMGPLDVPLGDMHDLGAGIVSYWVIDDFALRQRIKIADDLEPGTHTITGRVDYITCNETSCLPPAEIPFAVEVVVVAGEPIVAGGGGEDEGAVEVVEDEPYEYEDLDFEDEHHLTVVDTNLRPTDSLGPGDVAWLDIRLHNLEGWHVYGAREEIGLPPKLTLDEGALVELIGGLEVPDGEVHTSSIGDSYWLEDGFKVRQKFRVIDGLRDNVYTIAGKIEYVSCNETQCLMPKQIEFDAMLFVEAAFVGSGIEGGGEGSAVTDGGIAAGPAGHGPEKKEDEEAFQLGAFILLAIGAGLFALAMPCTYPMIPITISFFTKQAADKSMNTTLLSLIYGGGIITSFVLIGIIIGEPIIAFAQSPYLNLFIGAMFVVFALSLFGMFTIGPPKFLMNLAAKATNMASSTGSEATSSGFKGKMVSLIGVFGMGLTLVVTSFTCSAPFVAGLLAFGAKQGGTSKVALGMAVFGLTMAIPFMVLSMLPGRASKMPKAGEWMNTAKVFFGFVELAAALKFFSNAEYAWRLLIMPWWLFFALWALLFAAAAAYLFGLFKQGSVGPRQRLAAALTLVLAAYCGWGASGGKVDGLVMTPLGPPYIEFFKTNLGINVIENDFDRALEVAKSDGKLLLINFTGYT